MKTHKVIKAIVAIMCFCFSNELLSQDQESIIDTVGITEADLDATQNSKYRWYKDSLTKYSHFHFCRMKWDSTKIDSLDRFLVSLPTVFSQDITYNLTFVDVCNREPLSLETNNIEAVFYQGEYFHEPANEADAIFEYSSFRFLQSDEHSFIGVISREEKEYELVDLGNDLQLLCEVKPDYYSDEPVCEMEAESEPFAESVSNSCVDKLKILLIYTENALKNMGAWHGLPMETPEVTSHAWFCIADLNATYYNSGLNIHAELAAIKFLEIGETGNAVYDASVTLPSSQVISGWRNQYNADIVCQFTGDYAGINGAAATIGANSASQAFCVVEPQEAASNLHVFAHEVGHLFGCSHDVDANNSAKGHHFKTGGTNKRATVMDITWQKDRIGYYSNPNVNFMNVPTGTSSHNSAGQGIQPFSSVIRDFELEHNVNIKFERISCSEYPDFWFAEASNICLDNACAPLTFEWYSLDYVNQWGNQYFTLLQTGNPNWVYIPYNKAHNLVIVLCVRNCNGSTIFLKSHFIKGIDNNGNCLTQRSSAQTSISETDLQSVFSVAPNPNNGTFEIITDSSNPSSLITITDTYGKDLTGRFLTEHSEIGKIRVTQRGQIAKGIYFVKMNSSNGFKVKRIIIE